MKKTCVWLKKTSTPQLSPFVKMMIKKLFNNKNPKQGLPAGSYSY